MVEYNRQLDLMFTALSDSTRRDILTRVAKIEMSIGEIAEHYKMTFAGIAKHVKVLERAGLVTKKRRGKEQVVIIVPSSLNLPRSHVEQYAKMWGDRFDRLEILLKEEQQ